MNHRRISQRFLLAMLFIAVATASWAQDDAPVSPYATVSYLGQTATLRSQSRRCLSGALCTIALEFGIPISFEDTPMMFQGDYDDITSPAYHPKSNTDHLLVPKGGPMSMAFVVPAAHSPPADVNALLRRILDASARSGFPGVYDVRKSGTVWHIVPRAAKDDSGVLRPVAPLMDTKITLAASPNRTNEGLFAEIFEQIKKTTGRDIFIGSPLSHNYLEATSSASGEASARELLEQSFLQFGGHQLWVLQCTPRYGPCALSIF